MNLFSYGYMVRALWVGALLGIVIPSLGLIVVNKRVSMIGDALSHVSLAGVMGGLILGVNPILGALVIAVVAGLGLEAVAKRFPGYGEMATAIVMSTGVGLASILSGYVRGAVNIESFLFGSIVAITDFEWWMILAMSILVIAASLFFYRPLLYSTFDPVGARLFGVHLAWVDRLFMVLTALVVALASRTVGVLMISSLMVLPVAASMRFRLGYWKSMLLSGAIGLFMTLSGLVIAFYTGLKPGGTLVLLGVVILLFSILITNRKSPSL